MHVAETAEFIDRHVSLLLLMRGEEVMSLDGLNAGFEPLPKATQFERL